MCILRAGLSSANRSRFYSLEGGLPILLKANKLHFALTASTRWLSNQDPQSRKILIQQIMSHADGIFALRHPSLLSAMLLFVDQASWRGTTQLREAIKVPFASRSWNLTWAHTHLEVTGVWCTFGIGRKLSLHRTWHRGCQVKPRTT